METLAWELQDIIYRYVDNYHLIKSTYKVLYPFTQCYHRMFVEACRAKAKAASYTDDSENYRRLSSAYD